MSNYPPQDDNQQPAPYGTPQYGAPQTGGGEPPIWAPWYGIPFPKAFTRFWKKYVAFSGRASRSEYWWWFLWNAIIVAVLSIIVGIIAAATGDYSTHATTSSTGVSAGAETQSPASFILALWYLAILIPTVAIQIRRLHDINFRGWWILLNLIPFLGGIAVLIMTILPSNPEGQRFDRPTS